MPKTRDVGVPIAVPRARRTGVDGSGLTLTLELTKARRFHGLAQENLRRAESAHSAAARNHHRAIAEHYLLLAAAELRSVTEQRQSRVGSDIEH
jgi:hypothetical protein